MFRRTLVLVGAVSFSLVTLLGLMWFISSSLPTAHAKIPPDTIVNTALPRPTGQILAGCEIIDHDIDVNTTWTKSCYQVMTTTVTVVPGVILTISPPATGTQVYFQAGTQLQVMGNLQALGTDSRPITFTSVSTATSSPCSGRGRWLGIILGPNSVRNRIQHSLIEYACTGIEISGILSNGNGDWILSNTLRYNGGSDPLNGAIGGDIDYSYIENNVIHSSSNGIALNESAENHIVSNTISDIDHYGLILVEGGEGGGSRNIIADNEIHNCGSDGIRLEDGGDNNVSNNAIYSTMLTSTNPGGAIHLFDQIGTSVQYNHIYSNGGGSGYQAALYVTGDSQIYTVIHNAIYDTEAGDDNIEFVPGTLGPGSYPWPSLMAYNALCSIPSYELRNDTGITIDAPHNWWSTNEPPTGSIAGLINFTPWITLSPDVSANGVVTVTLRDQDGYTVPPTLPPDRQTNPPAPNFRRIELSSNWGTFDPPFVIVNDQGITTTTLIPGIAPAPDPFVVTATALCYSVTVVVPLPDLVITKTTTLTQVVRGGLITYTITYRNAGDDWAENVEITDILPPGTTYVSDDCSPICVGCVPGSTDPLVWTMEDLPANSPSYSCNLVLRVDDDPLLCDQSLVNNVSITTTTLDRDVTNNEDHDDSVHVIGPDVTINKATPLTDVVSGELLTYTITYRNAGSAPAENVVISDTLPSWTTYVSDNSGLTCPACVPGSIGPLTWTVGTLPPDSPTYSFDLVLRVDVSTPSNTTLTNIVSITTTTPECGDLSNEAEDSSVHVIGGVDLVVIKDDDVGPTTPLNTPLTANKRAAIDRLLRTVRGHAPLAPTQHHRDFVFVGDLVTYTIAINNVGHYTATNIVLTETLPLYTEYVGYGWTHVAGRTYTQAVGTLPPDEGRIYYFVVRVTDMPPSGNLDNLVCGWGDEPDIYPDDNCNREDTPVLRRPLVTKTAAAPQAVTGEIFTFTITYNNPNSVILNGVRIVDALPPYTRWYSDTALAAGWTTRTMTGTQVTWYTPTLAADAHGSFVLSVFISPTTDACGLMLTNVVTLSVLNAGVYYFADSDSATFQVSCPTDLVVIKDDDVGPTSPMGRPLAADKRAAVNRLLWTVREHAPLAPTQHHREFVSAGDLVTYTIAVINMGPYAATHVVLTETLPLYTQFVTNSLTVWTAVTSRIFTHEIPYPLPPGGGYIAYFVVRVDDPLPIWVRNLVNLVCGWGDGFDSHPDDNCNYEDTPVRAGIKLYVANRDSGTVDVFDTTTLEYIKTLTVGVNPFGMALDGDLLFVADFDAANPSQGNLHVVNTLSDTVDTSVPVGAHAIHVAAHNGYVYVASHSSPPPITIVRAEEPYSTTTLTLDRYLTYEFGFFGATADTERDRIYFTKRDFGGVGIWSLTPPSPGSAWLPPDYVYPTDDSKREKPSSILYHPTTDRVYVTFGLMDELWVFDPDTWSLLETISTEVQDPVDPGFGGHGLAALGQCVFVSNYISQSVTAIVDGSCVDPGLRSSPPGPPAGPYRSYIPLVGRNFPARRSIRTIHLSGRPKGMVAAGNLLFVTLPEDGNGNPLNRVTVINTETWTVIGEIIVPGDHPHTVVLNGGNYISPAP